MKPLPHCNRNTKICWEMEINYRTNRRRKCYNTTSPGLVGFQEKWTDMSLEKGRQNIFASAKLFGLESCLKINIIVDLWMLQKDVSGS